MIEWTLKAASLHVLSVSLPLSLSLSLSLSNNSQFRVCHEVAFLKVRAKNDDKNVSNEEYRKVLVGNMVEKVVNVYC